MSTRPNVSVGTTVFPVPETLEMTRINSIYGQLRRFAPLLLFIGGTLVLLLAERPRPSGGKGEGLQQIIGEHIVESIESVRKVDKTSHALTTVSLP
ncbi:hypothetical protein [Neolewinella antarctica]|uniref:Uncharacterized protein n=1 Tax=Neolewinella antarctica TaxID=442734 RepID=A0ABX0XCD3_9BACT|nr:hypothetical protein [Neolewinella antarctica]NJC26920.1 hypothetical protein [Neolewinella antarctica]